MTVQDQIRLWELERNRLKSAEGPSTLRSTYAYVCLNEFRVVRFSLQGLRFPSRLRIRTFVRQADRGRLMAERREAGFLWNPRGARKYQGIH